MSITRRYDVPMRHYLRKLTTDNIMRMASLAIADTHLKDFSYLARDIAETITEPEVRKLIDELQATIE